eukprot:SAG31_NODE_7177_length_1765_cov_1.361945_2_plen_84_part_00
MEANKHKKKMETTTKQQTKAVEVLAAGADVALQKRFEEVVSEGIDVKSARQFLVAELRGLIAIKGVIPCKGKKDDLKNNCVKL